MNARNVKNFDVVEVLVVLVLVASLILTVRLVLGAARPWILLSSNQVIKRANVVSPKISK